MECGFGYCILYSYCRVWNGFVRCDLDPYTLRPRGRPIVLMMNPFLIRWVATHRLVSFLITFIAISILSSDLHHHSHHVSNQPSWVGGWAVWPVTLLSLDLHNPPFHLELLWSFLTAKSIGVMALSWQYYMWPVWVWVSVFCLRISYFVFNVKT